MRPTRRDHGAVRSWAQNVFRLRLKEAEARQFILVMHRDTIRILEQPIRQLDKAMARHLEAIPETVAAMAGIGAVYGAGIVAEIGPTGRFPSDDALPKYAGLTWRARQSDHLDAQGTQPKHAAKRL